MIELHREADQRALAVRGQLQLGIAPIPDVVTVLEGLGLIVFVQPWGAEGPLGALLPRGERSYIFLNGDQPLPRLRFSGAHELGHHVFVDGPKLDRDSDLLGSREIEERRANSFAAAFLMPRDGIKVALDTSRRIHGEEVVRIATHFGVSYEMATYRLHNTGFVDAARRDQLLAERAAVLTPEFRRRLGSIRHLPSEYVVNAFDGYLSSRLDFDRLAELLHADDRVGRQQLARDLHEKTQLHEDDEAELQPIGRRR